MMPLSRAKSDAGRHDMIARLVLCVMWIAMIAAVNPIGDFPLNDDWMYGKAAQTLAQTGDFRILGPVTPNLLSQAVWGAAFCAPFGCSFTVLRFSTILLGLVGVITLYALLREIGADGKAAFAGSATLAVNPLYFDLANSFMTDVPFISLSIVSIYFAVRGFGRRSRLCLALGVLAALVALLDRQFAIVLLVGFAVAYPIKFGWRPVSVVKGLIPLGCGLLLHFGYQRWLTATGRAPGAQYAAVADLLPRSLFSFIIISLKLTARSAPYIGLFALPLTVLLPVRAAEQGRGLRDGDIRATCAALTIGLFGTLWWGGRTLPHMGDVLTNSGFGPLTLRDTWFPDPVISHTAEGPWLVATAVACFSVYRMLCMAAFRGGRCLRVTEINWLHAYFAVILGSYWFLTCLMANSSRTPFDRYLVFVLPVLMAWMASATAASARDAPASRLLYAVSLMGIAAMGAFSAAATHDYLAWNRARWAATDYLTQEQGIQATRIDGGYEFNGYFLYNPHYKIKPNKPTWWVGDDDYVVASDEMNGYRRVGNFPYRRWLPPYGMSVVVLQKMPKPE